ncbi:MAG: response regulator [Armatimonadetes bacterium]|nr:response regulator [Armatimonadota bacterium]
MKKKILVVDDQPHIVRLVEVNLQKANFEVVTAADGEEGWDKICSERPDLIILDVIMPKKDGFQVLHDLKTHPDLRSIPVIMLTVKTQNADIVESLREGADLYLPKPFHPVELVSLVKRMLDSRPTL